MAQFKFSAFDNAGNDHSGSVSATNAQEAAKMLVSQGLRVRMIQEIAAAPAQPATPVAQPTVAPARPRPQPQPQVAPRPQTAPRQAASPQPQFAQTVSAPTGQVVLNAPSAPTQKPIVRTRKGSDKDRLFLFAQISSGLRSGINPVQLFGEIAQRSNALYRPSLLEMGAAATEGISIATVMDRYPDLYPTHISGAIRAGERGGFLPDAADMISQQAEEAHKFRRYHWFTWLMFWQLIVIIPLTLMTRLAFLSTWDKTEQQGEGANMGSVIKAFYQSAGESLKWPIGPATLVLAVIGFALWKLYSLNASTRFRHAVAARTPVYGPRAKHENLTVFSWTLSKLTNAGLPFDESWRLASRSVPNVDMAARLEEAGGSIYGNREKLSDAVFNSNLFPKEYAATVATGEYAGSIPNALEQMSRLSRNEYEAAQNYAKFRAIGFGFLFLILSQGFMLIVICWMYYHELIAKATSGLEDK